MIYVMISPEQAAEFSRGLDRLMRPSHLRNARDVTDFYCEVVDHPSNGWSALVLPETETVPIHLEADGSELLEVLQIFVESGSLTEQEVGGITQAVMAYRGQPVRIADFIPPSWSQAVMTEEQARSAGWFPELPE
jgi:hypothetical protein